MRIKILSLRGRTMKSIDDYAEKSPFAVFGFRAPEAPKNRSKKLIEN
jgi:hypothetical protein